MKAHSGMALSDRPFPDWSLAEDTEQALGQIQYALDQSMIVAMTDRSGRITYANDKFCEISRYTRSELIGRDHRLVNSGHHPKAFIAALWQTIKAGKTWHGEIKNRNKQGGEYWVDTTIVPLLDESGQPVRYLSIRFDITERKRVEQQLEDTVHRLMDANAKIVEEQAKLLQAEKLSSLGLLAAGVAHEINNPLAGIMGCIKSLSAGEVDPGRRAEYFEVVQDGLERIGTTVQSLLGYARSRPEFSRIDLAEILEATLPLLQAAAREKNIDIRQDFDRGEVAIDGDRSQLMQACLNVLLNAIHASPVGGTVVARCEYQTGRVGLQIVDHGHGIAEADLQRVCDPFFSTKSRGQGTGLGLSVTLGIVRGHGGELAIDSEVGAGTTVTLWLPATGGG